MSGERACQECGGPINGTYGRNRGRPAMYCSAKCCNTFNLRRARERRKAAQQPAPALAVPPVAPKPHDNGRTIRNQRHAEGARHGVDPTTCEREYSGAELEFMKAVERYKRECKRPFPTTSELLEIAVSLGYRKVAPAGPLPGAK
jgi:hypothetical protein